MALSIKNAETERLARELAAMTGESVTTAVTRALRGQLEGLGSSDRYTAVLDQVRRISADTSSRWPDAMRHVDHGESLYDEHGLPR